MSEDAETAIARARHVRAFLASGYGGELEAWSVPINKALACQIVRRAPDGAKPRLEWEGDAILYLRPAS